MSLTALGPDAITERLYRPAHIAEPSPAASIDDAAIARFHRDGFLAVTGLFADDELAAYRDAIAELIAGTNEAYNRDWWLSDNTGALEEGYRWPDIATLPAHERTAKVRKLMRFTNYDARLRAMSDHPQLIELGRRLLGEDLRLVQDMALLKPAHIGREKPWHQDMAYFAYEPYQGVLGTWTALDAATLENGCMHVIPGSHLLGPRPHFHDRDCQLADEDVAAEQAVAVPLPPGGVLFFSAMLHHGTPSNRSADSRRAVQLHYAGESVRRVSQERFAEIFVDEHGQFCACSAKRKAGG